MQGMIAFDVEGDQANFHQIIWIPTENFTIALLVLPSILISISRTLEDILPRRSAIHRLRFQKMLLVLTTSN